MTETVVILTSNIELFFPASHLNCIRTADIKALYVALKSVVNYRHTDGQFETWEGNLNWTHTMFKLKAKQNDYSSCESAKGIRSPNSCLIQSREGATKMTKNEAVTVLSLWRFASLSGRKVGELVLTRADVLTAFRREISVVQLGGRDGRGYNIKDFHEAYQTLTTRMKNNKIKLKKERRR